MARRVLKTVGNRALIETKHPNGTWTEWVTLPPPEVDAPIRPLVQAAPELSLNLYGDPGANRATQSAEGRRTRCSRRPG